MKRCLLLFFVIALVQTGAGDNALKICGLTIVNSDGKNAVIRAEIADTGRSRAMGLMFRTNLAPDAGMLFVFAREERVSFWMRNTSIPLSIGFINSKGIIFEIRELTPFSERQTISSRPAAYALEVNRGWFEKNKIGPGSRLIIDGCIRK